MAKKKSKPLTLRTKMIERNKSKSRQRYYAYMQKVKQSKSLYFSASSSRNANKNELMSLKSHQLVRQSFQTPTNTSRNCASNRTLPYGDDENDCEEYMQVSDFILSDSSPSPLQKAKMSAASVASGSVTSVGSLWVPLSNLNPYITCGMCKGYLYEASTITECMHTFCKSCIVRHCERSITCPSCKVIIHPTDPFHNIKMDRTLQDILYKLLPHVAEEEQAREDKYYEAHPREERVVPVIPMPVAPPKEEEFSFSPPISLVLENKSSESGCFTKNLDKKFLRVMGAATVDSVAMFLTRKLCLRDTLGQSFQVHIYCTYGSGSICLDGTRTLHAVKQLYCHEQDYLLLQYLVTV